MKIQKLGFAMALSGMCMTRDASQTRSLPDFNKEPMSRSFIFERSSVNDEQRTVELSFSSEAEVGRWFGAEVLDHSSGAMRLDRIIGGALLVNHDWDDQIGVIESVRVDADKKGRATVRFGRSVRAEEIFQDVKDGIRKQVSVGYRIMGAKLKETRDNGDDVYLITDWEPYEISLVSVPADITVGVGRSANNAKLHNENPSPNPQNEPKKAPLTRALVMNWDYFTDKDGNQVRQRLNEKGERFGDVEMVRAVGDTAERGAETERKRVSDLMALGERFGAGDLVRQYIDENKSAAELQTEILERMHDKQGKPVTEQPKSNQANIGLTGDEARSFSLMRAVRAMMPNATRADREAAAFEFECSEAAQRAYGRSAQGILVPADVLSRAFEVGGATQNGGNLVGTDHRADLFIDMLRNRTTIMQLAQVMGGLVGNVDIPKRTGGATAYWVGEGEDATGSEPVVGQRELTPHTVAAFTDITRRLLQQGTPDAETLVWSDLNKAIALAIDKAAYYGTGVDKQPLGLKNVSGINAVSFGKDNPTFAELVQMETEIAADNAEVDRMAYVMNATSRGYMKTTAKFSGNESTIWEPNNTVNGYRTEVTNQITSGDIFFGNFADLIIGLWGGLDITVDPYSLSKSGGLRIVCFQDVDFALRNTESICYGKKSATI